MVLIIDSDLCRSDTMLSGRICSKVLPFMGARHGGRMSSSASATTADKLASAMEKIHKMDMAGESSNKGVNAIPQVHQKYAGRKRFYKHVGVVPVEDAPHLYRLTLDGRTLRTPARNPMHFPNKLLAMAVAAEWDAQTEKKGLEPASMPLTTLSSTSIDQVLPNMEDIKQNCMRYLPTDSALFFTSEDDRILLSKQRKYLSPAIRHLNRQLRIDLEPTTHMARRIEHSEETLKTVRAVFDRMDHFTLACAQSAVMECKSVVLALTFLSSYLNLEQAKAASRLEEEFQVEIWGVVEGGHDMDRLNNSVSLASVDIFLGLLHGHTGLSHLLAPLPASTEQT